MLEFRYCKWLARDVDVYAGEHRLARIDFRWMSLTAQFQCEGARYTCRCHGWRSQDSELLHDHRVIGRAWQHGFLTQRFDIEFPSGDYELRVEGFTGRTMRLIAQHRNVGYLRLTGVLWTSARLQAPAELSLPEQLFLYWLGACYWHRQSSNAAIVANL
ncbi:MAG: hypothetical protein ACREJ2_18955 [Planctomycetota bacterium]